MNRTQQIVRSVSSDGRLMGKKVIPSSQHEFDCLDDVPDTRSYKNRNNITPRSNATHTRVTNVPTLRTRRNSTIELPKQLTAATTHHAVKSIIHQCTFPSLAWGMLCILPLKAPQSGWSGDNVSYMIWLQLSLLMTSVIYLEWGGMFWGTTKRIYLIAVTVYAFVGIQFVTVVAMASDAFPLPLHVVLQSLPWVPVIMCVTYIQLDAETKSTPKFLLSFTKFHITFLVVNVYFVLCASYLVLTSLAQDDGFAQMVVLSVFSSLSFLAKRSALRLTRIFVPRHQLDPTRDTVTEMSHNMFYYLELCNELFVMLSFINLKFKAACMVIVLELFPLAFRCVRLTPIFYSIAQEYFPWVLRNQRMDQFRLYEARILVIQLFAEFNAMVCFFVLGSSMRFGPNADFFPMRQLCDKDMLPVVGYVGFNLACYTILVIIVRNVAKEKLGVDLFAFAAEHATHSYRSMLASSMSCTCFPVYLLLFHSSALSWIDPDTYVKQEDC